MNRREFLLLTLAGVVGVIAIIPYTLTLQAQALRERELPLPLAVLIPLQVVQNAIVIVIVVGVGFLAAKQVGLGAPVIEEWLGGKEVEHSLKYLAVWSVTIGVVLGLLLIILDISIFAPYLPERQTQALRIPVWQRFLAVFYGGITEELLMRFGLFSVLAWLLGRISYTDQGLPSNAAMWAANIVVAVLFGLGHLPAMARLGPITVPLVARAITLNGIAGLVFGYLYWKRGLEAAMLAHFTTDVILHVILPAA